MTKGYYYCQECQNTVEFNHECVMDKITQKDMSSAFNTWAKEQHKLEKLKAEIELSETIYEMDYEDDARLVRLERKIDAIIEYLTENTP